MRQDLSHSIKQLKWVWLVWLIWFNSSDLPKLTTFKIGSTSLHNVCSLSITSTLLTIIISDVPFNYGYFSVKQAFAHIQPESIITDESMTDLH